MKQIETIFKALIISVIILIFSNITPASAQEGTSLKDSVEVSLLTCSPHEEIYSLYGHTALRYVDLRTGEDWAFNYGIFSFKKPFFVLRFTMGITDYELGVVPFEVFKREYKRFGSQVVEQVLNISSEEKQAIYYALKENYLPENRVYRYNFFYDNCTTRARDMIESNINGEIKYADDADDGQTYRDIIHQQTRNHPWAAFGNDLCLGMKSDLATNQRERQFLPANLMYDFDHAQIYENGGYRPLVKARNIVVAPGVQVIEQEFPITPTQAACLLLAVSFIIAFIEYKNNHIYKVWDVILMLTEGIAGIIIVVLFFSEHPTTSTNLQVLLLNPIPLFFITAVIRGKDTFYWKFTATLIVLFFIGCFLQDYAEGMEIVALSLLTRCWMHLKKKPTTHKYKGRK